MKSNYFESHQSYISEFKNKEYVRRLENKKYEKEILKHFPIKREWNEKIKVLEIWFWNWKFASFCHNQWFDYTWIDIDDYFSKFLIKEFPNFKFIYSSYQDFSVNHKNEYDVIFLSHTFEHLNQIQRSECIKSIYEMLKNWWIRINYMPNADSILRLWTIRYNDITHFTLYNHHSFSQLLHDSWYFKNIESYNTIVWFSNILYRLSHIIFLFFTKIYYLWIWASFPLIYTQEFISIIKK